MEVTADELAGVVDLFGALTRAELQTAVAELAFKDEGAFEPEDFGDDVDAAVRSYHLLEAPTGAVTGESVEVDDGDPTWLVSGPLAFPELPEDATDLPHILDTGERGVDREAIARAAEKRFRADAASAVDDGDPERLADLREVSYELEAWGAVDLAAARELLDGAAE